VKSLIPRDWLLVILLAWLPVSIAQAAPKATVLDYGYYEFTGKSERLANTFTTTGYVTRGEVKLVEKTHRIPVQQGRLFGFRFRIDNMDENVGVIPLELVVRHPEMHKPDGSSSTGYRYRVELKVDQGMLEDKTGYRLNEPYELVEGEWSFEYRFMNRTLLKQTFTTYKP
jgi:hypothetical protein